MLDMRIPCRMDGCGSVGLHTVPHSLVSTGLSEDFEELWRSLPMNLIPFVDNMQGR